MCWIFLIALLLLSIAAINSSAENNLLNDKTKKFPTAIVVGTVYCDTCLHRRFSNTSHFISGASVAVECKGRDDEYTFREELKTNKHGEFELRLPFSVAKHVRKIQSCSVDLMSSNDPKCSVASRATSPTLHLHSRKNGDSIFSAGFFTFKPSDQPSSCRQNPNLSSKRAFLSSYLDPAFPPPIEDHLPPPSPPPPSLLPPIGHLLPPLPPLPQLPPLPPLPGLPGFRLPIPPKLGSASP